MKYYNSANDYFTGIFGEKAYKLSLDAGCTCPNRDGTVGFGGCIFCSKGGSGDFAEKTDLSTDYIQKAIERIRSKYKGKTFIAYFQAYTGTYGDIGRLRALYMSIAGNPLISGISIATRPDCLSKDVLLLLQDLAHIKPLFIELGLQTVNPSVSEFIRRGYPLGVFDEAALALKELGIPFIVHMIVGLPGETKKDYLNTADYIAKSGAAGIKIQLLHILKDTDLYDYYLREPFPVLSLSEYARIVVDIIERLPRSIFVHRITGDGPKALLAFPLWSADKKNVINTIHREFESRKTCQGRLYNDI